MMVVSICVPGWFRNFLRQYNYSFNRMESNEDIRIKIYTANPQNDPTPNPSSPSRLEPARKRRAVAKGMQETFSKTSMLVNFLPTGTLLTFEMLLPSVSNNGDCSPVGTQIIHSLLGLCSLSCSFLFTDSFKGPDGTVCYGFVTPRGLAMFEPCPGLEVPKDDKYKVGLTDCVHANMSVPVFAAIAFPDHRVTVYLFPGHVKDMDQVMESCPLIVGIICGGLFLVFPNTRYA